MVWRNSLVAAVAATVLATTGGAWGKSPKEAAAQAQASVTMKEAIAMAMREVPGAWLLDADVGTLRGQVSYAIELVQDGVHTVRVDMQNGRVLNVARRRAVDPKSSREIAAVEKAPVSLLDAIAIAEEQFPGGKVVSADVTTLLGVTRWDIAIERDGLYTVHVDPADGRVLAAAPKIDD